jgi:hypothetical protein
VKGGGDENAEAAVIAYVRFLWAGNSMMRPYMS